MTTNTDPRVEDLAALVRRLARALDKPSGNTLLARQALEFAKGRALEAGADTPRRRGRPVTKVA